MDNLILDGLLYNVCHCLRSLTVTHALKEQRLLLCKQPNCYICIISLCVNRVRTHPYLSLFSLFYTLVKIGALISPYFRDRGDFGLICPYFLGCRIYSFRPIDLRFCMNVANRLLILSASFCNNSLNSF